MFDYPTNELETTKLRFFNLHFNVLTQSKIPFRECCWPNDNSSQAEKKVKETAWELFLPMRRANE